jgi:hypothetical protein
MRFRGGTGTKKTRHYRRKAFEILAPIGRYAFESSE